MGVTDEEYFYAWIRDLLEEPYLAGANPRAQSGFGGDATKWERNRRPCAAPVHRDGTYLDVGCASGLLMEDIERWTADDGYEVEAHGLDISTKLADLARRRLPEMAGRIHIGNVMTWTPPQRYTYVRTELEYVPDHRRPELVARLLDTFLEAGGRAIICSYGSSRRPEPRAEPVADMLTEWGFTVTGSAEAAEHGVVVTRVAWVQAE